MWWAELYLILTLLVVGVSRYRSRVSFDGAVALLVWLSAVQLTYQRGEIETTPTVIICVLFCLLCLWMVRIHHHWLPWYLMSATTAILVWTALYPVGDPYLYKAVKNGIYVTELCAVCVSYRDAPT